MYVFILYMSNNVLKIDIEIFLVFFYLNFCKMYKYDIENKINSLGDFEKFF